MTNTIVEKKNTMPVLANVKLNAENGLLSVAATDLEVSLLGNIEADVKTPGTITVNGKVIYEIVRELPDDNVVLKLSKGQRLEVECGSAHFKINGISSDEFPSIMGLTLQRPIPVEAAKVSEMLDKTSYAVSLDETRYNITGVCVEMVESGGSGKDLIRFVATDGHRLAYIDRPADGIKFDNSVIVPRKGIQELRKVLDGNDGACNISLSEGFFTVQTENVILGIRLVDGQFPDYRQVIPNEVKTTVDISKDQLLSMIRRVSLVTTDKSRTIKLKIEKGSLLVSSSSPEYGEASESMEVKQNGEDVAVGFSAKYILEIINAMPNCEVVTLKLCGELGPGVFVGDDDSSYLSVVMPMRFE